MLKPETSFFVKFKPQNVFVIIAFCYGLTMLAITPPFQVPDEIIHFYRSYQISEGQFLAVKYNDRIGGNLPKSLTEITKPFLDLRWNNNAKTKAGIILSQFKIPLNENDKVFVDFPNNALYSPVSYFSQASSIFILRKFDLPPLFIFYGARFFTLLFWIVCMFYIIRIMPFYKWLMVLLALLPMSAFINMSLSADVMTNILSFALIAFVLNCSVKTIIANKDFIILIILAVLLASAKIVYIPLVLLILMIPKENFGSRKQYFVKIATIFVIALAVAVFWSVVLKHLYLPYSAYNEDFRDTASLIPCVDANQQLKYIFSHGFYIISVLFNSMIQSSSMYIRGYIGTFGWLDTLLPVWFICVAYISIFTVSLIENTKEFRISLKQKTVMLTALITTVSMVLLSQHLSWDCVGGDIIFTIQGRYFIPVFPLFFMMFYNNKLKLNKVLVPLVILFVITGFLITSYVLFYRYYI